MKRNGHAVVEVALMAPWILFLFIGIFDFGFFAYALISVQNAARVAVMHTSAGRSSASDSATACQYALGELTALPNVRTKSVCDSNPVAVTSELVTGPDSAQAARVTVNYRMVPLIPIPGVFARSVTITRVVEMRLRS